MGIDAGGADRTQAAAQRIKQHVNGHHTALRIVAARKDQPLVADMQGLAPKSSSTMPNTKAAMAQRTLGSQSKPASGSQASSSASKAHSVARCAWPLSTQRPATVAANAPATPTRPNRPMAVCEKPNGAARSGSTRLLQKC